MGNVLQTNEVLGTQLTLQPNNRSTGLALFVAAGTPGVVPSPLQGAIFIDPQNASLNAGLGPGFGASRSAPLKSAAGLVQTEGTLQPTFTVPTVITYLSASPADGSDPFVLVPFLGLGGSCVVQGDTPTVVTAGVTLSGTTAKNRAAGSNSPLITNLGATAAVGQMVQNRTVGKNSRAFVQKALGGNSFEITQPCTPLAIPGSVGLTEVDTWADGDTVDLLAPIAIDVAYFDVVTLDDSGSNATGYVYQCTVQASPTIANAFTKLGDVRVVEATALRRGQYIGRGVGLTAASAQWQKGFFAQAGGTISMQAGSVVTGLGNNAFFGTGTQFSLGTDFMCGSRFTAQFGGLTLGTVFIEDGNAKTIACTGTKVAEISGTVIYGTAGSNIGIDGASVFSLNGNTAVGSLTAPALVSPGMQLNGASTGSTHTNATPDVLTSGVATTPTNIDAATGSVMFNLGGASIRSSL